MFGKKEQPQPQEQKQGFNFDEKKNALELIINGKTYYANMDSAEFLKYWREKGFNLTKEYDKGKPEEAISDIVEFVVALIGTENAQEIFNNSPRSFLQYIELLDYINTQIEEQDYAGKFERLTNKYSRGNVLH